MTISLQGQKLKNQGHKVTQRFSTKNVTVTDVDR